MSFSYTGIQVMKKYTSPVNEFLLHTIKAIGQLKKINLKNVQVQLMSFYYTGRPKRKGHISIVYN